jgi:hypothetical protein
MSVKLVPALLVVCSLAGAAPVWAQAAVTVSPDLRDIGSARSVAMGGAFESTGYGGEAINGNPAALSLYKRYVIEASGMWDIPQAFGNASLGILDSTNALATGVSYNFATYGGFERRWAHVTTLGFAYSLGDVIHLGIAGRNQVIVGAANTNSITLNAGLIFRPAAWLSLGFSGHNLIPVYNVDVTRYFVASVSSMIAGQLTPAFDMHFDFNQPVVRYSIHGGLEWLIAQMIPIRAGYEFDGISGHQYIAGGLGYFSSGSGIDLAYRHELGGAAGRMLTLTVKLQF